MLLRKCMNSVRQNINLTWLLSSVGTVRLPKNRPAAEFQHQQCTSDGSITDILKVLMRIILTSKDSKERADATALKKNIDNFNFIVCIIIWERILTSLHRVSQKLQAINTDLSASVRLLSAAHGELQYLRDSWDSVLLSATAMSSSWGIKPEFTGNVSGARKHFTTNYQAIADLPIPCRRSRWTCSTSLLMWP